jgi:signal transduction histidine kinase
LEEKEKKSNDDFKPRILVSTQQMGDSVGICIRDNGIGIPEECRKHIFEPFFTTKPSGQANTGLGLSISMDIIHQEHGGSLQMNSKVGDFTEFVVTLPVSNGKELVTV